jgi:hypothetical protein
VVDKLALEEGFFPAIHTELHLKVALTRKEKREKLRKIPQKVRLAEMRDHWQEFPFTVGLLKALTLSSPVTSVNIDQSTHSNIP